MRCIHGLIGRWLFLGVVVIAWVIGPSEAPAQTPVIGEEVFVTLDADTLTGWTANLRGFQVRNLDGSIVNVDFNLVGIMCANGCSAPPYVPNIGIHGPILTDGQYELEPFLWEQNFGNLSGAWAFSSFQPPSPTNSLPFTQVSGPLAGARMGVRVGRVDRQVIELIAVEYMSADTNFEIGTKLTTYTDFASFQVIAPPVLASPNFLWLNLPNVPLVRSVRLAPATFAVSSGNGAFSLNAIVTGATLDDGTIVSSTAVDPLIGGTLTMSGAYSGIDLIGFSDVVLAPTTSILVAIGGDQLTWTKSFIPGPDYRALAGAYGTFPNQYRLLEGGESLPPTRSGSGSQLLTAMRGQFEEEMRIRTSIAAFGPVVESIEFDFEPPSATTPEHRWATDGAGGVSFGIARAAIGSTFRNFAFLTPTVPLGMGPFFGIEFGSAQMAQVFVPFGTHPIFAAPDATGSYFWGTPQGILPAGLVVDLAYIEISAQGSLSPSSVTRLIF